LTLVLLPHCARLFEAVPGFKIGAHVLDLELDGINLRLKGIEVSELGRQSSLAGCSRGAVRGHATAICTYVVVVGAAAGLCDVAQDGVTTCASVLHADCVCVRSTHLLWRLLLSSVPRMPSSRRRADWLVCAVVGAVFKNGQSGRPTLAAGVSVELHSPACWVRTSIGGRRQRGTEAELASLRRGSSATMMISLVKCKWNATSLRIAACAATRERGEEEEDWE
jgi:hypothetical protein